MSRYLFAIVGIVVTAWGPPARADEGAARRRNDQAALKAYGSLVGDWKGTGQVQRGSGKGAWRESAAWSWKLSQDSAALEVKFTDGKYFKSAVLKPGDKRDAFVLEATLADG